MRIRTVDKNDVCFYNHEETKGAKRVFGYISVNPTKLTEEEKKRYRAFYCGLCHTLGEHYGSAGRATLSNDMTFLSLLLNALYEPTETVLNERCTLHPARQHMAVLHEGTNYAADMNILLAYHKCEDDVSDEASMRGRVGKRALKKAYEQVKKTWPRQAETVAKCLSEIARIENKESEDLDALTRLSGRMLGECLVWREDAFAPYLRDLGGALGKFVYLMDAWEDHDGDVRKGCFNPLREMHAQADYEDLIHDVLLMKMGEASEALKLLPLQKDVDLIENVVYHGVWQRYDLKMKQKAGGAGEDEAGGCADPDGTKESDR